MEEIEGGKWAESNKSSRIIQRAAFLSALKDPSRWRTRLSLQKHSSLSADFVFPLESEGERVGGRERGREGGRKGGREGRREGGRGRE